MMREPTGGEAGTASTITVEDRCKQPALPAACSLGVSQAVPYEVRAAGAARTALVRAILA